MTTAAVAAALGTCSRCGLYRLVYLDAEPRCRRCAGLPPTEWDRMRDELRGTLERVAEAADDGWLDQARALLREYLRAHETCHVDDWWAFAQERGLPEPREARALGAVFAAARRAGWMQKTGRSLPSVRSNGSEKPLWRSLLHGRSD